MLEDNRQIKTENGVGLMGMEEKKTIWDISGHALLAYWAKWSEREYLSHHYHLLKYYRSVSMKVRAPWEICLLICFPYQEPLHSHLCLKLSVRHSADSPEMLRG